ncbi:hypothetical protein B4U79_10716, partial [Dinothrombium tinctorium]
MLVREIKRKFSNITTLKKKDINVIWCYGQDQKNYEIPINGNIKLNPKLKTRLQKHKKIIRALATEKKRSKRRRIANQIGGILPFLIPAAATTLGDNVRIVEVQNVFEKGYMQKWTDEVLKIYQVIERPQATMYGVRDFENTPIKIRFNESELQNVSPDVIPRIRKIVNKRERKGEEEKAVTLKGHSKVFIRGFYGLPLSLDVEITLEKCNIKDEEEIVSYINYEVEKAMSRIKHKKDRTKLKALKLLYKKRTKKFSMQSGYGKAWIFYILDFKGEIVDILGFQKIPYFDFSARFNENLKKDPEARSPGKYLETLIYCISP